MLGLLCAGTSVAVDIPLDGRIEETQVGRYEVEGPFGFNRKYFSDEIPCREVEALIADGERLARERSYALERQALAVKIGDLDGAQRFADIARGASVRLATGQALLEVIGAARISTGAVLMPSSDLILFLTGQSYKTRRSSYYVFRDKATVYRRIYSPFRVWFGSYRDVDWKTLEISRIDEKSLDRSGSSFAWEWRPLVPNITVYWRYDKPTHCGWSDQRGCVAFDFDRVQVELPVDDYCRGARNGGDYELIRIETEYSIPSLSPDPFVVTRRFGFRLPDNADSLDTEQQLIDGILKDFVVSVLGSDQSYRVSDDALRLVVEDVGYDIARVRQALDQANDRIASSAKPLSDKLLLDRFKERDRYVGVAGGLVAFTAATGAGAIELTFSRDTQRIRLERIRLNGEVLFE